MVSQTQGEQIASYIRRLTTPAPNGAWAWNPPYQPGPGLDSKPAAAWAADAGVNAVLNSDKVMEAHLFPVGTSTPSVNRVVDRFSTLNIRELPIAMQLPDWNSWLPRLHPSDVFNRTVEVVRRDENGQNLTARPFLSRCTTPLRARRHQPLSMPCAIATLRGLRAAPIATLNKSIRGQTGGPTTEQCFAQAWRSTTAQTWRVWRARVIGMTPVVCGL